MPSVGYQVRPGRLKSSDGPGVVHRGGAAGRRDHRLDPLHRLGDVEVHAVQLGDGGVEQVLVPPAELVDALDGAVRVGLEVRDHLVDGRAGDDALRDRPHRVLDAVQLLPPHAYVSSRSRSMPLKSRAYSA